MFMEDGSAPVAGVPYEDIRYNNLNGTMHPFERGNPLRVNTEQGTGYVHSGYRYRIYGRYDGNSYTYLTSVYHSDHDYTIYL